MQIFHLTTNLSKNASRVIRHKPERVENDFTKLAFLWIKIKFSFLC